jgi:hypothetical protein
LEYTIGSNGVACLGKITGHLKALERVLEWVVPQEADSLSVISFKMGNFMSWDPKAKKFAGERYYLFFKGAERSIQTTYSNSEILLEIHRTVVLEIVLETNVHTEEADREIGFFSVDIGLQYNLIYTTKITEEIL